MNTKKLLTEHCKLYPSLNVADVFKFIYQSAFGCEHMVSSLESAISRIEAEASRLKDNGAPLIEKLDGDFSRINLKYLKSGLSTKTLGTLFFLSAKDCKKDFASLLEKINVVKSMAKEGLLPFSYGELVSELKLWEEKGFPAVHHSASFREKHSPSYRVISNKFIPFLPLFCEIDKKLSVGKTVLSIEGGSASGKSTLGMILSEIYGATVFHTDDFFLQPQMRTKERLEEIGGNLDRERFLLEVILPLSENQSVFYKRFDCQSLKILPPVEIPPADFTVIEGSYSTHPYFSKYYSLSVFLQIDEEKQRERIKKRNSPSLQKRFFTEWIPMENKYFEHFKIKEKCDFVIQV